MKYAYKNQGEMEANAAMQNTKFSHRKTWYFAWRNSPPFDLGFYKQNSMISCTFPGKSMEYAYKNQGQMKVNPAMQNTKFS